MTLARFLLINSFVIFLVLLIVLVYIFREDLQLSKAYSQFTGNDMSTEVQAEVPQKESTSKAPEQINQKPSSLANSVKKPHQVRKKEPNLYKNTHVDTGPLAKQTTNFNHLLQARQAYWDNNFDLSIERYRILIQSQPENADYYGELGNVFYAMKDFQTAAELYYRAAILLQQQGNQTLARQLIQPIMTLNQQLAINLESQLNKTEK